jgi:hypothetical protein
MKEINTLTITEPLTLRAIAALREQTIRELAVDCGLDPDHLYQVSAGRTTMTAEDLMKIHLQTEIPVKLIRYEYAA